MSSTRSLSCSVGGKLLSEGTLAAARANQHLIAKCWWMY
jgi:hypothetical protein